MQRSVRNLFSMAAVEQEPCNVRVGATGREERRPEVKGGDGKDHAAYSQDRVRLSLGERPSERNERVNERPLYF